MWWWGNGAGTGFSACSILCWFAHKLPSVGFVPELLVCAQWGGGVVGQSQQRSSFRWMSACALLKKTVGLLTPKAHVDVAVPTSSFRTPSAKSSERMCLRKLGLVAAFPWRSLVPGSSGQHISMAGGYLVSLLCPTKQVFSMPWKNPQDAAEW